ncbi:unnamed protein product [Symbiodinium microadriaticum]|nr:unnamed protein product [Symbiodinium microadriaticum]
MSVDVGGDSVMDAPTQPIPVDDAEGEDEESPLTHASRTAERAPPVLGQLHNEDLQARNEALRDAAIAAEALKAATSAAEVIPLAEPNPYALAAAHVSSTAAASTAPGLALPVNSRRQRERSTTASTLGGRPAIDDFQIVIGGWNDAKRGDIEAEIRNLFELNQASPLLHNIHVPFVRSKFARVELLYTGGNLTERRKVQSLVIEALKKTFRDFKSNISGQESRTLWVTRNRSKEDREKIRALVSIKDWAFKHTSAILIDLDWRGKLWIRGEQVLYWHQFRRPDEGAMMLTNAAGDETGWWVDVRQLSRILAIPVDQVRDELLD